MVDRSDYYEGMTKRDSVQQDLDTAILNKADQTKIDSLKVKLAKWNEILAKHPGNPSNA